MESPNSAAMTSLLSLLLAILLAPFRSNSSLAAENASLRHQVIVLRRKVKGRVPMTNGDRWFLVQLYRWFPSIVSSLVVIKPETLIRWHRAGFRRHQEKATERGPANKALAMLFPGSHIPGQDEIPNKQLCSDVNKQLKEMRLKGVNNDSILRAAGRRK
jgi:hypothetical protein